MFNIGAGELVLILVAALLVLGPQRLPEFARVIGKFVREFRRQTDEVRTVVEREFYKMDQEFQDEPRPQVPLATPAALPSPAPVIPSVAPVAAPEALAAAAVPVDAARAAPAEPSPASEPSAAGAELPDALPRPEPIPGTVARNTPKSG